jgi:hypothetical protein
VVVVVVVFAWTVGACSATHGDAGRPTASVRCTSPTLFGVGGAAHEVRGASRDATAWGLALGPGHIPPRSGEQLKIVWRMTGSGPLTVAVVAPDGRARPLVFGPEPHSTSSYHRPGDEWGTGFLFDRAGCWHISLTRADTSADVWLDVAT